MTVPDFTGMSPFHLAIKENAANCIAESLRFVQRDILEYPDSQNRIPLVHAIQLNNIELSEILIEAGTNINHTDQVTGQTPLHFAAELSNGPIIELLIRGGGILDILDGGGLTPIHTACIAESPDGLNAIIKVVGNEVLNLPDARGLTPLMHACSYGNEATVKLLLKKKVCAGK